jgi:3-hydroxyisobutyrate dehydrogenase
MGSAIASRLVDSYELFVSDKNPAAAEELVQRGATFASTDEIAAACRVVFLCLPGPADVSGLLAGSAGLASRLSPRSIVIDTTTSTPATDAEIVAALRERGAEFADAPIGGGVRRAREGTAVLMVGAAPEVFAKIKDLLLAVTQDVIHVGPVGTGHAMKLVNNLLNACNRFAALETVRLGQVAGLSQDVVIDVLNKSSGRNYATEYTFPQLLSGDSYRPQGFTLELMRKDIRLANELAASLGHRTPIGTMVQTFTEEAIARFGGDADQSQMMAEWYKA